MAASVEVYAIQPSFVKHSELIKTLDLTFQIPSEAYTQISTTPLFNLHPNLRLPLTNGDFHSTHPIQIQATLHPDHLAHLLQHATTPETALAHLQTLSQNLNQTLQAQETIDPDTIDPLLKTENWFALTVKQIREDGETGHNTLWNYIDLTYFQDPESHTDQLANGITQFFADLTEQHLTDGIEDLADSIFTDLTRLFDNLNLEFDFDTLATAEYSTTQKHPILNTLTTFFNNEDWSYLKLKNATLQLAYQGNNGSWTCYAQAREPQQQFVFYSIAPLTAPDDKKQAIAEFITRANYGTILGNFELDFNDGEIRYKTSIDIEDDRLTTALIRNLVYSNLMMMDQYLPGIIAVIEQNAEPKEAIQAVETD